MAVAIRLLFVLTLGFIPTLYGLFFRVKFKDFVYPGDEATPAPTDAMDDEASTSATE